ncbi:hypothetical protein A2774_03185 [Candidatus Roizmanbacteria bacterium RIFCSPHIGHO2_01_FULL_39_12c]|uniref:Uncharacterized protein n=1 Tax=Candidatus Roizmanbacteria bacterium RIFCSPHIGHO2_01_FULL_39_12c TaxID=1802031 RepID=A0A1F7GCG6_9BACT|nr:MAG: hypothetical protein A2774_03185 [Candidatus Roizmanbacteria bacterium RIFCSPHIGHO2_01_FULL_39_12c]
MAREKSSAADFVNCFYLNPTTKANGDRSLMCIAPQNNCGIAISCSPGSLGETCFQGIAKVAAKEKPRA